MSARVACVACGEKPALRLCGGCAERRLADAHATIGRAKVYEERLERSVERLGRQVSVLKGQLAEEKALRCWWQNLVTRRARPRKSKTPAPLRLVTGATPGSQPKGA